MSLASIEDRGRLGDPKGEGAPSDVNSSYATSTLTLLHR